MSDGSSDVCSSDLCWQRSERTRQDPAIAAALREARHPASGRARRVWWPALAVAASLLVAVGLMFSHQLLPDNVPAIRYATVLGEQRSVTLKDGSQRSEERRVGKGCVSTCRSWCRPDL